MSLHLCVLVLVLVAAVPLRCDNKCVPRNNTSIVDVSGEEEDGLTPLLSFTASVRQSVFPSSRIDYTKLREDVRDVYNDDVTFSDSSFIGTAFHYCQQAYFLAAFILTVSILFPGVILTLWFLWAKCYDSEDEGVELLPNKHLSLVAQVISFSMGCGIITLLVSLLSFVILLIIGNERVGVAVKGSQDAIQTTLPTIYNLHQEFLTTLNDNLVNKYNVVMETIEGHYLGTELAALSTDINSSLLYEQFNEVINEADSLVSDVESVMYKMAELITFHETAAGQVEDINTLAYLLQSNVTALLELCNGTEYDPCSNLTTPTSPNSSYVPIVSPLTLSILPNETQLRDIYERVKEIRGVVNYTVINERVSAYNNFILEIEGNMTAAAKNMTNAFVGPVQGNVTAAVDVLQTVLGGITYGLPESQAQVEDALGDEYLANWQDFRNIATVAFSLSLIVFIVGVVVAIVRGVVNTIAIYTYGDDISSVRGAHHSALMLRSLAVWVSIVGVVSAFFFVFILCLGSIVGRGCGSHGNYSEIIDDVIDNNVTWNGTYPLGGVYHGDSAYPLRLHSVITSCYHDNSAAQAIQLSQLVDLLALPPHEETQTNYIVDMKGLRRDISFSHYSLLGTHTIQGMSLYQQLSSTGYPWQRYQLLSEDIFHNSFVGLEPLKKLLSEMSRDPLFNMTFTPSQQQLITNTVTVSSTIIQSLAQLIDTYTTNLSQTRSHSSFIQLALERAPNATSDVIYKGAGFEALLTIAVDETVESKTLSIATNVSRELSHVIRSGVYLVSCDTALCRPVGVAYNDFTHSTCDQLVDGLDILWSAFLFIFINSLLIMLLLIALSCHLADRELFRRENNSKLQQPYNHVEQVLARLFSCVWMVLVFGVEVWFVVAIATDKRFDDLCDAREISCCSVCLWVMGMLFLMVSLVCVTALKCYQFVILRRIKVASKYGKVQQVTRYWLTRLRAAVFYEGLTTFFLLHIAFIAISGSYITTKKITTPPSFASLLVSLVGVVLFIVSMVTERGQIFEHLNLLQQAISTKWHNGCGRCAVTTGNGEVGGTNGGVATTRGVQLTAVNPRQSDHTPEEVFDGPLEGEDPFQETTFDEDMVGEGVAPPYAPAPPIGPLNEGDEEEEQEVAPPSIDEQLPKVLLDRLDTYDSDKRQEGGHVRGRVRLAHPYLSQYTDASTPRSSLYMSEEGSVTGSELPPYYLSSSHMLGYTSTDESSTYRDDYDSYESDYTNSRNTFYSSAHMVDGKQVDV